MVSFHGMYLLGGGWVIERVPSRVGWVMGDSTVPLRVSGSGFVSYFVYG